MYTSRHNKVLEVIIELLRAQCETANQQSITAKEPIIQFLKEGECPLRKQKNPNLKLRNGDSDWKVSVDLKTSLQFLVYIIQTEKRLDIVAWSDSKKSVLLIELTVPWEENREEAHERKENQYTDCVEKGWICHVIPIEVGCRGFLGHCHFVSFKNRNPWLQFESCLKSSSDCGATCIKLDLVESEKFSTGRKCMRNHHSHVIVTPENCYCKHVMTWMAKSKCIFFFFF